MQQGDGNFQTDTEKQILVGWRYNKPRQTDQKLAWKFEEPHQTSLLELSSLSGSNYRCKGRDSTEAGTKLSSETEILESCVSP